VQRQTLAAADNGFTAPLAFTPDGKAVAVADQVNETVVLVKIEPSAVRDND
jgi:hypothetical protein